MKKQKKIAKHFAYGLVSFLVLGYAFWIMYTNYQSQVELRELALKRVEADFVVKTKTIETFLIERQKDITNLAADRTVMTYFENKDLGMTMMYGLAISVRNISKRFEDFYHRSMYNGKQIFASLLLLDDKGKKLAEIHSDSFQPGANSQITSQITTMEHDFAQPDYILITIPCVYKEKTVGTLLAWISYEFLFHAFLIQPDRNLYEHFLFFTGPQKNIPVYLSSIEQLSLLVNDTHLAIKNKQVMFKSSSDDISWLIFAVQQAQLPFQAIKLINRKEIFGSHNPEKLFIGMITIFSLLFVGMIMLIQLSLKQQINAVRLVEAEERHRRIQEKNKELEIAGEKIRQQNEELKELDRLKDDFLANTTHEFKTPLNGIIGLVVSILNGQYGSVPSELVKPLEMIDASGNRLMNMVMQILTFSNLAQKKEELTYERLESFNLSDVLLEIIADFSHTAASKKIEIISQIPDMLSIQTDLNLLSSIFRNLVDNALKYTEQGKLLIFAEIYNDIAENDCIRVIIEDTGIGIKDELQSQIFDRFFQGFASENRKGEGAGIGLSIVKEGLLKLNGSIKLFSVHGIGSQFTVFLPTKPEIKISFPDPESQSFLLEDNKVTSPSKKVQPNESITKSNNFVEKEKLPVEFERVDNRQSTILVVDDDAINREVVRSKLFQKYELDFAETGKECLDKISSNPPDLILLDLMMPGMSGYDVLERMNNITFEDPVPVICLSAKTQIASINRALRLGAVDYITKPFNGEELIVRIETHLKQSWLLIKAQESSRLKNEFLANMSHEIRTPMNAVIGLTDALLATNLSKKQISFINMLKDSGEHLMSIINDILDFSKIEAGKLDFQFTDFAIHKVVKNIVEMLSIKAKENNVKLSFTISPEVPDALYGDPVRIKQIIMNLAGNAVKFTHDGTVDIFVKMEEENYQYVMIHVRVVDSGIGIPEDKIESLFNPFVQVDGSATRKFGGTGLGLSISKKLVNQMNGTIGVDSEDGKGSTFWFTVMLKKSQKSVDDILKTAQTSKDAIPLSEISKENTRILLAEDNIINQKVALVILENCGFNADVVNNGQEAVDALGSKHYDIVLMDCQMPVLDGYEATHIIRNPQSPVQNHQVIIVAMTANAMQGDKEKCLNAGMDDFLAKPIKADRLNEILVKWMRVISV